VSGYVRKIENQARSSPEKLNSGRRFTSNDVLPQSFIQVELNRLCTLGRCFDRLSHIGLDSTFQYTDEETTRAGHNHAQQARGFCASISCLPVR
jgi:hypothetical protein